MASKDLDDTCLIPIPIQKFTKHTTGEECCKAYAPWAKTYNQVTCEFQSRLDHCFLLEQQGRPCLTKQRSVFGQSAQGKYFVELVNRVVSMLNSLSLLLL